MQANDDGGGKLDASAKHDANLVTKYMASLPDAAVPVPLYMAAMPDASLAQPEYMAPLPDASPVMRYMAQLPDAGPAITPLYLAQTPSS